MGKHKSSSVPHSSHGCVGRSSAGSGQLPIHPSSHIPRRAHAGRTRRTTSGRSLHNLTMSLSRVVATGSTHLHEEVFNATFHQIATIPPKKKTTAPTEWQTLPRADLISSQCNGERKVGDSHGCAICGTEHLSPVTPTQGSALTSQNQWQFLTPLPAQ